jgi:DinB family protein
MAGPVIPERYAKALGKDDPVEVMATTPDALRKLIEGLTERQLATKPAPGKWSMKEIVAHLLDGEVVLGARYRMVAAGDKPPLTAYDQDAFVDKLGSLRARTADLVDDFAMARAVNLGLLERLPADAWDRVGLHAERGEESIRSMVTMYAGHDRHHLSQIETIRVGLFPKRRRSAKGSGRAARQTGGQRRQRGSAGKKKA